MLRHFYRLMVVALGVFVASSCNDSETIVLTDYDVEATDADSSQLYGCPSATFHIEGTVTAVDGTPIKGVEVSVSRVSKDISPYVMQSDDSGEFLMQKSYSCLFGMWGDDSFMIDAVDVDGIANGYYLSYHSVVTDACKSSGLHFDCTKTDIKIKLEEATSDDDTLIND